MGVLLVEIKNNFAYLLITCNDGKLDDVMTKIEHLDSIKEIQGTLGVYDIVAKVESATLDHLQQFIVQKIRSLVDVRSAMTLLYKPNIQ